MFRRCLVHLGSIFGSSSCLVCLDWCLQKPSNVLPLETVKLPFGVSSRACLWKVQQLLLQNQLPYWGEPGLHLKVCISCERVRPEPPCLPWCMPKGPCTLKQTWQVLTEFERFCKIFSGLERLQGLLELLVFVDCSCSCTDLFENYAMSLRNCRWSVLELVSACHVAWCSFVCMPSRMTAIFNPFSEALRRPQITEMYDLVCSGCIGRYGQWAWAIRDPFDWLGQWFQSTRRKVSGWLQRHKLSETWLDLVWCRCKSVWCACRLLWSHERILWLWHVPEMLGSSWFNFWF